MSKISYLFKNITVLNVVLAAALIFFARDTVMPLLNMHVGYTLPAQKKSHEEKATAQVERKVPSPTDYIIVSENNLFHPDRKIPPEKQAAEELPKPDILLYGTLITDDLRVAYVEDLKAPRTSAGRGKRQTAVRKGDTFSGFTVKEIDADRIVMVRGEETIDVSVLDPQKRKERDVATTADRTAPGQPPHAAQQAHAGRLATSLPKTPPSTEALVKKALSPKTRARMSSADEKARGFFTR